MGKTHKILKSARKCNYLRVKFRMELIIMTFLDLFEFEAKLNIFCFGTIKRNLVHVSSRDSISNNLFKKICY